MEPALMEPRSVLDFYESFLTLVVLMLSTSACAGLLTSVILLFLHPKRERGGSRGLI